jgi:hypothetical protein
VHSIGWRAGTDYAAIRFSPAALFRNPSSRPTYSSSTPGPMWGLLVDRCWGRSGNGRRRWSQRGVAASVGDRRRQTDRPRTRDGGCDLAVACWITHHGHRDDVHPSLAAALRFDQRRLRGARHRRFPAISTPRRSTDSASVLRSVCDRTPIEWWTSLASMDTSFTSLAVDGFGRPISAHP